MLSGSTYGMEPQPRPIFCSALGTITDIVNRRLTRPRTPYPRHKLDNMVTELDTLVTTTFAGTSPLDVTSKAAIKRSALPSPIADLLPTKPNPSLTYYPLHTSPTEEVNVDSFISVR